MKKIKRSFIVGVLLVLSLIGSVLIFQKTLDKFEKKIIKIYAGTQQERAELIVRNIREDLLSGNKREAVRKLELIKERVGVSSFRILEKDEKPDVRDLTVKVYFSDDFTEEWGSVSFEFKDEEIFQSFFDLKRDVRYTFFFIATVVLLFISSLFIVSQKFLTIIFDLNKRLTRMIYIPFSPLEKLLIGDLAKTINLQVDQFNEFKRMELEQEKSNALVSLSTQLAHDIRSPLAALNAVVEKSKNLEEESRELLIKSSNRITEIAENLLSSKRGEVRAPPSEVAWGKLINEIIKEKKVVHDDIDFHVAETDVTFLVIESDFKRVLSNLLNNSIEALKTHPKKIEINLVKSAGKATISIKDNGKGIPPQILESLFKEGATFGKEKGNGLGLFHAKKFLESAGGSIEILSTEGVGTTVNITLPAKSPMVSSNEAILIDDDLLVRMVWESKAKSAGVNLKCFGSTIEFEKELHQLSKECEIYIDHDLPDGIKGDEYAKLLFEKGFTNITLATGHPSSFFGNLPHIKKIIGKEAPW